MFHFPPRTFWVISPTGYSVNTDGPGLELTYTQVLAIVNSELSSVQSYLLQNVVCLLIYLLGDILAMGAVGF